MIVMPMERDQSVFFFLLSGFFSKRKKNTLDLVWIWGDLNIASSSLSFFFRVKRRVLQNNLEISRDIQ